MDTRTRRLEELLRRVRENAGRTDPVRASPEMPEAESTPAEDSPISLGWSALLGDIPPPAPLPLIEPSDEAGDIVTSFPSSAPGPRSDPPQSFTTNDDAVGDLLGDSPMLELAPASPEATASEAAPMKTEPPPSERPRDSALERAVRVALLARSDSEPPALWRELELQPRRVTLPPSERTSAPSLEGGDASDAATVPRSQDTSPPVSRDAVVADNAAAHSAPPAPRRPKKSKPARLLSKMELSAPQERPLRGTSRSRTSPWAIALGAVLTGATFAVAIRVLAPSPTLAEHVVSANLAACAPPIMLVSAVAASPLSAALISAVPSANRAPMPEPATESPSLPPTPNPKLLRPDEGYLLIAPPSGRSSLKVFVQGVAAGDAGTWLRLPCGARFVRIAERLETAWGSSFPSWVEAGTTIVIPCRSHAVVHMDASARAH